MDLIELLDGIANVVPRIGRSRRLFRGRKRRERFLKKGAVVNEVVPEITSGQQAEFKFVMDLIKAGVLRWASVEEYYQWLFGYFAAGGKVGVFVDSPFLECQRRPELGCYLIALKDFSWQPVYSTRVNIIVPSGVKYLGGNLGTTCLLFADGYQLVGEELVPGGRSGNCGPWLFNDRTELVLEWKARGPICGAVNIAPIPASS